MSMLLDIHEPGQAPVPHEENRGPQKRVAGIDLGTTFSLVAAITQEGTPACIPDEMGNASLPSVVHFGKEILVGADALELAVSHPETTIASAKRLMGRSYEDVSKDDVTHALVDAPGMVQIDLGNGERKSPVEVAIEVLKVLKERAEEALGGELEGAVITVPAYFDDAQRQATKDAGKLAGLNVMRLVNEPTAAALAYGLEEGAEGVYAIYDLGGGTFDISILKLEKGVFQVLSTGGNSALGGDDFDHRLANVFLQGMGEENPAPGLMKEALRAGRRVKEALTAADEAEAVIGDYRQTIKRAEFDALIQDLVRATGLPCRRALKDAGVKPDELQGVVLVGGSTRVPAVRAFVEDLFKREPHSDLDPDQVVALGAAHQADLLAGGGRPDLLLLDVNPLSLGLETMGELVEKIVPRNSPIPTARAQEFTTFKDGQTAMAIHVVQGERETVDQCRSLARFELRGIPPMTAGAARIRVTFRVDADGLLTVSAREETTGVQQEVEVKPAYGLDDDSIERMLRDALVHSEHDVAQRLLREARVDAERVLGATSAAMKQDGDLLSDKEKREMKKVMLAVWETTRGENHDLINQAIKVLDDKTKFFAQRRMDRGIAEAMTGHSVDDFVSEEEE